MSADRPDDWEADDVEPSRDASREPGLDAPLAAENAELYKRVDSLQAELKMERARHDAWAREMAWREETMKSRIERLEHALVERQDATGEAELPGRLEEKALPTGETTQQEHRRGKASNEIIAVGVAYGAIGLSAIAELMGTPVASSVTSFIGEGIAAGAATLAWMRKQREG